MSYDLENHQVLFKKIVKFWTKMSYVLKNDQVLIKNELWFKKWVTI